jgi:osmotically-inducible protein OsmY
MRLFMTKILCVMMIATLLASCQQINRLFPGRIGGSPTTTTNAKVNDKDIESRVKNEIQRLGLNRGNHIKVDSFYSLLLITGEVTSPQHHVQIDQIARSLSGARKIYNYLKVIEPTSYTMRSADTLINTTVRKNIMLSKTLSIKNIKPVTTRSEVYLIGVGSYAHVNEAINVARTVRGAQKVVNLIEVVY